MRLRSELFRITASAAMCPMSSRKARSPGSVGGETRLDAALHQHVLGQVDAAHAAGTQQPQQLVPLEEEALVAAFEEFLGLPVREHAGVDQLRGDTLT